MSSVHTPTLLLCFLLLLFNRCHKIFKKKKDGILDVPNIFESFISLRLLNRMDSVCFEDMIKERSAFCPSAKRATRFSFEIRL